MDMNVNEARSNNHSTSVNYLAIGCVDFCGLANRRNPSVLNHDIQQRIHLARWVDHASAANENSMSRFALFCHSASTGHTVTAMLAATLPSLPTLRCVPGSGSALADCPPP